MKLNYMKDYDIERPDSDFPDYEEYEESNEDERLFEEDDDL